MTARSPAVLNDSQGQLRDAVLLEDLCRSDIDAAEAEWQPFSEAEISRAERSGQPRSNLPEHRHWDWRRKYEAVGHLLAYRFLGIECDSQVQGLMLVATAGRVCRIESQRGLPLIYIHFLATAPWNSRRLMGKPRFSGVGSVLLAAAVRLSTDEEFGGRVGLHSLPQADGWYRRCRMTDLGPDPSEMHELRYFEMTPENANDFLREGVGS